MNGSTKVPMAGEIRFYSHNANREYAAFSNFSPHPVTINGREYPTTEHYFQARKFAATDREYSERIRAAETPGAAKRLGSSRAHPLVSTWDTTKERVMKRALRAKFTQHADLRELLLSTGDATLIEAAPRDYYWGHRVLALQNVMGAGNRPEPPGLPAHGGARGAAVCVKKSLPPLFHSPPVFTLWFGR